MRSLHVGRDDRGDDEMTGEGIDFVIIYAEINRKCLLLQAKQR